MCPCKSTSPSTCCQPDGMVPIYNRGEVKHAITVLVCSVPLCAVETAFTRVLLFLVHCITSITAIWHFAVLIPRLLLLCVETLRQHVCPQKRSRLAPPHSTQGRNSPHVPVCCSVRVWKRCACRSRRRAPVNSGAAPSAYGESHQGPRPGQSCKFNVNMECGCNASGWEHGGKAHRTGGRSANSAHRPCGWEGPPHGGTRSAWEAAASQGSASRLPRRGAW